jgi:hypothetical protein
MRDPYLLLILFPFARGYMVCRYLIHSENLCACPAWLCLHYGRCKPFQTTHNILLSSQNYGLRGLLLLGQSSYSYTAITQLTNSTNIGCAWWGFLSEGWHLLDYMSYDPPEVTIFAHTPACTTLYGTTNAYWHMVSIHTISNTVIFKFPSQNCIYAHGVYMYAHTWC